MTRVKFAFAPSKRDDEIFNLILPESDTFISLLDFLKLSCFLFNPECVELLILILKLT